MKIKKMAPQSTKPGLASFMNQGWKMYYRPPLLVWTWLWSTAAAHWRRSP